MKKPQIALLFVFVTSLTSSSFAIEDSLLHSGAFKIDGSSLEHTERNPQFKKIDLDFVIETNSSWSKEAVFESHIERIEKSLNSCQLTTGVVQTIFISVNEKKFSDILKTKDVYTKSFAEVDFFPVNNRYKNPTIFLLQSRKTYSKKAFAMTKKTINNGARSRQDWANLTNTSFITDDLQSNRYHTNSKPNFSVVSHEIGHLLGELSHVYIIGNLMSSSDDKDSKDHSLNAEQCAAIRANLNI